MGDNACMVEEIEMGKSVTVVFVASSGRSGSTLIDLALNEVLHQPAVGELVHLWRAGPGSVHCGCGSLLKDCSFWQNVFRNAGWSLSEVFFERMLALQQQVLRWRYIVWLLFPWIAPSSYRKRLEHFVALYERLYLALAAELGTNILVDSSKNVLMCLLFPRFTKVQFKVIHLIRDPRAVVYSWRFRRKVNPAFTTPRYMQRLPIWKVVGLWWLNLSVPLLFWGWRKGKYVRLGYDSFAQHPEKMMGWIISRLQLPVKNALVLRALSKGKLFLNVNHTVSGNPLRFKRGEIVLRHDEEWRKKMPVWAKLVVSLSIFPWLLSRLLKRMLS